MKYLLRLLGLVVLTPMFPSRGGRGALHQTDTDPTFADILGSGRLPKGQNSNEGVTGRYRREQRSRRGRPNAKRSIPQNIRIHTLGNTWIPRRDFEKWSRWYQEDGSTQVFRLFKGETNVRNDRKLAARVEPSVK